MILDVIVFPLAAFVLLRNLNHKNAWINNNQLQIYVLAMWLYKLHEMFPQLRHIRRLYGKWSNTARSFNIQTELLRIEKGILGRWKSVSKILSTQSSSYYWTQGSCTSWGKKSSLRLNWTHRLVLGIPNDKMKSNPRCMKPWRENGEGIL